MSMMRKGEKTKERLPIPVLVHCKIKRRCTRLRNLEITPLEENKEKRMKKN